MRKLVRRPPHSARDLDTHAVDELILFADNDSAMYRAKDAYLSNVYKKMKKGTYEPELGVKLWTYYAERAAKEYARQNLSSPKEWSRVFPPDVRKAVAKHYEKEERGLIQRGEYDRYPSLSRDRSGTRLRR